MKAAVVYWSGTGNTAAMADLVLEGMQSTGAQADLQLEDSEFEPMFDNVKKNLSGKKIALFGSYGWGDGEWMRNWEDDCRACGIKLACESVLANGAPEGADAEACRELGKALV